MGSTYHRTTALPFRLVRRLCIALPSLLALWLCTPTSASTPHAPMSASTLQIAGAGDGQGVGMSQEGALGYAEHGYSYQQILAHYYSGTTIGRAAAKHKVKVLVDGKVRRIPLEAYVRGVVGAEMSPSWPAAALEAQAVASRTYALTAHAGENRFDVYADSRSQVYRGKAAESPAGNAAVKATAGQIVAYQGRPAITYFFASSGGMTESVQNAFPGAVPEPWLQGVPDPFDAGPLHSWHMSLSFKAVAADLKGLVAGTFRGIEVLQRGTSPRIITASVLGSKGSVPVSGDQLAARLRLYDTWAYFSVSERGVTHPEPDRSAAPVPAGAAAPKRSGAPASASTPAPTETQSGGAVGP
jgi:SpoIID/LytB domain protein